MRVARWACYGATVLLGCGPGSSSGQGSGGGTASRALTLHTTGTGSGGIRSSSPSFECKAQCTQSLPQGSTVQLVAVADAGSTFAGWQGACSGTGNCTLTMDADRDATASFSAVAPPPAGTARLTVQAIGTGTGRVTSSSGGLDCRGTCTITLVPGTTVSLSASADPSSRFAGWGGACSGSAGCSVTANGDQTVWANFDTVPPPVSSCAGIAAPDAVAMQQYVQNAQGRFFSCGPGVGDASGTLGFTLHYNDPTVHADQVDFVNTAGVHLRDHSTNQGLLLLQQPSGASALAGAPYLGPLANRGAQLTSFDSAGVRNGDTFVFTKGLFPAADPAGGVLIAGDFALSQPDPATGVSPAGPVAHAVAMFTGGGIPPAVRWGPKTLASSGAVFGVGVDLLGRSLVITDGAPASGAGAISAQWFDRDGTPLTAEFVLLSGFVPGPSTWFETSPLIPSGLMVRRMDRGPRAQALVVLASGSDSVQPAPAWMVARPDTRLQIARGGRAYAVLPYGAAGVPCSQRLEVVASDGTSCGTADHAIAKGACDTKDLTLGADGTVIQQLPDALETKNDLSMHTCTWRWWSGAVK